MKYNNIQSFEKHLKAAAPQNFSDVYLVNSKEEGERGVALNSLLSSLLQGQESSLLLKTFDCQNTFPFSSVLDELEAASFLQGKPLVQLLNVDRLGKESKEALQRYLEKPAPFAFLVMTASSLATNTRMFKLAEKNGIVLHLLVEKPWEKEKRMMDWLAHAAQKEGKKIQAPVCHHMVKQMGVDMVILSQELEKLFCYVGERKEILQEDVSAICMKIPLESIWQMSEGIFQRDCRKALKVAHSLLEEGQSFFVLLAQLRRQFQTGFHIASLLLKGVAKAEVTKAFPYMTGRILEKNLSQVKSYGFQNYKKGLVHINETDYLSKTSNTSTDLLLEILIVKLCW